jgi:hypothetical protein
MIMAQTFTDRQLQILTEVSKTLEFNVADVTAAQIDAEIPTSVTYSDTSGTFTRDIHASLGGIITDAEYQGLVAVRQLNASNTTNSLSSVAAILSSGAAEEFVGSASQIQTLSAPTTTSFNPSQIRLTAAGLEYGAESQIGLQTPIVNFAVQGQSSAPDFRVKISDLTGLFINGGNPPLVPLVNSGNCVVFPYTPQITLSHTAHYAEENLTHSNYTYPFFQSSSVSSINITGKFTAKNATDAAYVIAVQHFFRTVSKMFYGDADPKAGVPPPVLRLDGHGDYQFKNIPIVIKNFTVNLPPDVDYITGYITSPNGSATQQTNPTRVPVIQEISIECLPLWSRTQISQKFSLTDFAKGTLLGTNSSGAAGAQRGFI